MATSFASSAVPSLRYLVTEKLARNNHSLWKAQVLSALQDVQVAHFLRSTTPIPLVTVAKSREKRTSKCNPDYETWVAKDQQILNYLLSSLSRDILV